MDKAIGSFLMDETGENNLTGITSFAKKLVKRVPFSKLKSIGMKYLKTQFPFLSVAEIGYNQLNEIQKKQPTAKLPIKMVKIMMLSERQKYLKRIKELEQQLKGR